MSSGFKGPIWFGVCLVTVMLSVGGWLYFKSLNQGPNLGVHLSVNSTSTNPSSVLVGDPFTLSVVVSNDSSAGVTDVSMQLVLPDNVISVTAPDQRILTQSIGAIDAGGVSHEDFHIMIVGGANTVQHFTAKVIYATAASSAQFESDGSLDVPAGSGAIAVSVTAPQSVYNGESFPLEITYGNATNHILQGFSIAIRYPPAFTLVKASTSLPSLGSGSWNLLSLQPGTSGAIDLTGNIVGVNGAGYPFDVTLIDTISGRTFPMLQQTANVAVTPSPLSLQLGINNNSGGYVSMPGDSLNYVLTVTNNSQVALQSLVVSAHLSGAMFDFGTIQSAGAFSSVNDTLTWTGANASGLSSLAPGQSLPLSFSVRTRSTFPIRLMSDKNYTVEVQAAAQSPTVPPGTSASSTVSITELSTKLKGAVVLSMTGFYRDPTVKVSNAGPYPPKVNKATQYSIHWIVKNYATDADNVTIGGTLQSGATCTGQVSNPIASSTFMCDPANGQVTWQIPFVAATTGMTGRPLDLEFQVQDTPAVNQVGQEVPLIGPVTLTATDAFTGSILQQSIAGLTTGLPDDTSIPGGVQRLVTQ